MPPTSNRQVLLSKRPQGVPRPHDFRIAEGPPPVVGPGRLLHRHHYLSLDSRIRGRKDVKGSYAPPCVLDAPPGGGTVALLINCVLSCIWELTRIGPEFSLKSGPYLADVPDGIVGIVEAIDVELLRTGQPQPEFDILRRYERITSPSVQYRRQPSAIQGSQPVHERLA